MPFILEEDSSTNIKEVSEGESTFLIRFQGAVGAGELLRKSTIRTRNTERTDETKYRKNFLDDSLVGWKNVAARAKDGSLVDLPFTPENKARLIPTIPNPLYVRFLRAAGILDNEEQEGLEAEIKN